LSPTVSVPRAGCDASASNPAMTPAVAASAPPTIASMQTVRSSFSETRNETATRYKATRLSIVGTRATDASSAADHASVTRPQSKSKLNQIAAGGGFIKRPLTTPTASIAPAAAMPINFVIVTRPLWAKTETLSNGTANTNAPNATLIGQR